MISNQIKFQDLISEITAQVVSRLDLQESIDGLAANDTLVLIPAYVPDVASLSLHLKTVFGCVEYLVMENYDLFSNEFPRRSVASSEDRQQLMTLLNGYSNLVLALPPVALLKNITQGNDSGFVEQLVTRAILWGKKLSIIIDYPAIKSKRIGIFADVAAVIDELKAIGAEIVILGQREVNASELLALVTEEKVIEAHQNGKIRISCAPGVIITPLARDKAADLGICLE